MKEVELIRVSFFYNPDTNQTTLKGQIFEETKEMQELLDDTIKSLKEYYGYSDKETLVIRKTSKDGCPEDCIHICETKEGVCGCDVAVDKLGKVKECPYWYDERIACDDYEPVGDNS